MAVLSSALDPIITIDPRGVIRSASESLFRVFGWTPAEVIGRNVSMFMPEPHRTQHDEYLARYRRTGVTNILGRTRQFDAMRKDGSRFPIELSVSRADVPDQSEPVFIGIIHDVSERQALEHELMRHRAQLEQLVEERTRELRTSHEQLRQADRLASIGTLAAGLGHDMNNVLLPIRARLDAIEAMELPTPAREQFTAIRRSLNYLQQLSDGLHLLALDPEDAQASTESTDLRVWWQQVSPLLLKAAPKRVKIESDLPADLPMVRVPPHRLTQAVLNLVVNAGEAIAGDGVVRVSARLAPNGRPEPRVQLSVTDNGEGMTPEVRAHALDPFFTTKKRGLGTGLGLSLVQGMMVAVGGMVDIQSEVGRGTTVTLTMPALEQDLEESKSVRIACVSLRDRRAASFVGALLQSTDYQVHYASPNENGFAERGMLWITEPSVTGPQSAKRWLRADHRRRVVIFSPRMDEWAALGVLFITDITNFDAIRRTVGEAVHAIEDSHDEFS